MVAKFTKIKKNGGKRNNLFFGALFIVGCMLFIFFLLTTNWKVRGQRTFLNAQMESLNKEIEKIERRNQELKEYIAKSGTKEYIEKIAREQLGLKSPGEEVVIISREKQQKEEKAAPQKNFWDFGQWWAWIQNKLRD